MNEKKIIHSSKKVCFSCDKVTFVSNYKRSQFIYRLIRYNKKKTKTLSLREEIKLQNLLPFFINKTLAFFFFSFSFLYYILLSFNLDNFCILCIVKSYIQNFCILSCLYFLGSIVIHPHTKSCVFSVSQLIGFSLKDLYRKGN